MGGITGWVDWEEDLTHHGPTIEAMAATFCRQGLDDQGCWLSPRAALAHRCLDVIDLQDGKQPMAYQVDNRTYVITYNGEIYNFRELRSELESLGHTFRTQSDTEVLLHAYVEWGEACVGRLNGMFAFGLWDDYKQQLLLARDHLGLKPLFYAQRGNAMLFGSDLKALLVHPEVKAEIDATGIASIFGGRRAPGSGVFRDVHELRPGHLAIWTRNRSQVIRYWNLHSMPHPDDLPTTVEHIRALLEDTVRRQLIADIPVVALLSGGLNSSILAALLAREFKRDGKELHTYTLDFVDSEHHFQATAQRPDLDAPWARRVSEYIGSKHHTTMIDTPELVENLLVPMRIHNLPAKGQIETSQYLMCKAMKEDATVGLAGGAADEVFGGHFWFHNETAMHAPTFPWLAAISMGSKKPLFWLSPDVEQKIQLDTYIARTYQESLAEVSRLEGEDPKAARRREIFYLTITNFLPMILDRNDRMSTAVGFKIRMPFCDHRLVEYLWNIPWDMKMAGNGGKGILRQAMIDVLPDDVRNRRKSA